MALNNRFRMEREGKTRYVRMPLVALIILVLLLVIFVTLLWSTKRRVDTRLAVQDVGELHTLLPSIAGVTQGSLDEGNKIEVTQNGDGFFPLLFRDIAAAKQSVHIETFIWWEGKICDDLVALLAQKARGGVEVRLLVDASGGKKLTEEQQKAIEDAGGEVARFHPPRLADIGRLNNRDHRKLMIIDGRIGFIGGYGIGEEWTGNAQDRKHYRDTGLRVEGPVVNRLQGAFCENWIETTGKIIAGDEYFPRLPNAGSTTAHVAYTSPSGSVSSVEVLYYLAIKAARREIIIQNPYLLPEKEALDALAEAVQRGVKVYVMVPSDEATDNAIVQHASHHHFGSLLKRGVRIWEYDKTLLHQKLMIVDGAWSCVGSTNFDARSFELNDEISIGVIDPNTAAQLRAAFFDDMRFAKERKFDEWSGRSIWHKLQDGVAYLGHEQL
jgi:cardiolipin synthase A/B